MNDKTEQTPLQRLENDFVLQRLENDFVYHAPINDQVERYARIRTLLLDVAKEIVRATPVSREQSLALTNLEQAMFWANASIARNESE